MRNLEGLQKAGWWERSHRRKSESPQTRHVLKAWGTGGLHKRSTQSVQRDGAHSQVQERRALSTRDLNLEPELLPHSPSQRKAPGRRHSNEAQETTSSFSRNLQSQDPARYQASLGKESICSQGGHSLGTKEACLLRTSCGADMIPDGALTPE